MEFKVPPPDFEKEVEFQDKLKKFNKVWDTIPKNTALVFKGDQPPKLYPLK